VLCFLLENPNLAPEKRNAIIQEIEAYINLAKEYAGLNGPVLIITRGLMGSGKTSLATVLSQMLEARLFSSDAVRKELAGIQPETNMQEAWDEGIYSPESTENTYTAIHRYASAELQKGNIVILDASYLDKKRCKQACQIAGENQADFFVLETICPEEIIKARLLHRQSIETSISDGRLELFQIQKNGDQDSVEDIDGYHIVLDSSKPLQDIAYLALKEIYHLSHKPSSRPTDLARNLR
jgi:predicted kinase